MYSTNNKQFNEIMDTGTIKSVGRPLKFKLKSRPWITEAFNAGQQLIEPVVPLPPPLKKN